MMTLILIGADGRQVGAVELNSSVRVAALESLKALGAVRVKLARNTVNLANVRF
jgi:hypothetical protein